MTDDQDTFSPSCFLASILLTSLLAFGATKLGMYGWDFWIWDKNAAYLGTAICLLFLYWGFKGLKDDANLKQNTTFEIDKDLMFNRTQHQSNQLVRREVPQALENTADDDDSSLYATEMDEDSQYKQDLHFLAECKRREVQNHNHWVGLDAFSWWFMNKEEQAEYLKRRDRFLY